MWSDGLLYAHNMHHTCATMVIWYDKCVRFHTIRYHNASLGQLCQPFIWRTQINCVKVSAFLLADGRRGQTSMEYDPVRLAATGI